MINNYPLINIYEKSSFYIKPIGDGFWINGGYFILNKKVDQYLSDDKKCIWEKEPLSNIIFLFY